MPDRKVQKFTDKAVAGLKPEAVRYFVRAPGGLCVRVSPTGRRTWLYSFKLRGRKGLVTLGDVADLSVADAMERHARAVQLRATGIDPARAAAEVKRERTEAPTVEDLARDFVRLYCIGPDPANPNKRTWREDQRILSREILPAWGPRLAREIRRRDVIAALDEIVARGASIQANRTLAVVRRMFRWAVTRDIVQHSPCEAVERPAAESERDRVLRGEELERLLAGLTEATPATIGHAVRLALLFALYTAQRAGEVGGLRWAEVDLRGAWWTLPGARTKNGLAHRVPLSPPALAVLREAATYSAGKEHVFPSTRGDRPLSDTSMNQALRRCRESWGIEEHFSPHDVRRSVATGLAELGFSRFVIGRILNHKEGGITRVYDRASYDREKRAALDRWAAHLEEITERRAVR